MAEVFKIDQAQLKTEIEQAVNDFRKFNTVLDSKVGQAVTNSALLVEGSAKKILRDDGHVRTARLLGSISHTVEKEGEKYIAYVGTNVYYGFWLEFGTRKMQEYPYLRPAMQKNRKQILALVKKAIRESEAKI